MSIPISFITCMASGCVRATGVVPAEYTSSIGSNDRKKPSAIWLLHELPVHRTRIRYFFAPFSGLSICTISSTLTALLRVQHSAKRKLSRSLSVCALAVYQRYCRSPFSVGGLFPCGFLPYENPLSGSHPTPTESVSVTYHTWRFWT